MAGKALFVLFVAMLPGYADTAKIRFASPILPVMLIPLFIAATSRASGPGQKAAGLSLIFVIMTYPIGCLAEDHFEAKSATIFTSVFVSLLLAKTRFPKPSTERELLP